MGLLADLIGGAKDLAERVSDKLKGDIEDTAKEVKNTVKDVVKDVKSDIEDSIKKVNDSIKSVTKEVGERVGGSTRTTQKAVDDTKEEIKKDVRDNAEKSTESLEDAQKQGIERSKTDFERIWEDITEVVPEVEIPEPEPEKIPFHEALKALPEPYKSLFTAILADKEEINKTPALQTAFTQLETTGYLKDLTWKEGIGSLILMLGSFIARMSNEPLDRSISYDMNAMTPNAIAPVSDLVRFELREVFRPNIRPKLLEEPASDEFKDLMEKFGYSSEMSDNYWAAHWELPSIFQGMEMYQRLRPGVVPKDVEFNLDDLNTLLKQQDVLPFYRDRLTSIAYLPITRVDIRRMRELNVLKSEKEVQNRYQDLGYSPEDAKLLARWTELEIAPQERVLNRTFIEKEYQEGRFTVEELTEGYRNLGYRDSDVERLVDSQVVKLQRTKAQEAERRETGARTDKVLPPSSTLKAYTLDIIDRDVAAHKLIRYGYDRNDTEILLRITEIEKEIVPEVEVVPIAEEITTVDMALTAFRAGAITEERVTELLTGFGVSEIDIARLLAIR